MRQDVLNLSYNWQFLRTTTELSLIIVTRVVLVHMVYRIQLIKNSVSDMLNC